MPVLDQTSSVTRNWTGVETLFTTGMQADAHIDVIVRTATATLVRGTHYSTEFEAATDKIAIRPLVGMPAAPQTLTIGRSTPAIQPDDPENGNTYDADAFERQLNRIVLIAQELRPKAEAALALAQYAQTLISDIVLTGPVQRVNGKVGDVVLVSGDIADLDASAVPYTPTGGVAATTVQTAIAELDAEQVPSGTDSTKVGYDYSVRNGPTILIPPARYRMADHLAGGVPSGSAAIDTTAYNAVVAQIVAAGGTRILELPGGTVKLTSGIQLDATNVNGMAVVGQGRGRSIVQPQNLSGNDIVLGNTALALGNFSLDGFSLLPFGTKTAGAGVLINDAQKIQIDIEILGGFRGFQYENAGDQAVSYVENPYVTGLSEDAFVIGLAQSQFANGLWVNSGIIGQCRRAATFVRASGIHFDGTESYQASDDAWCFEPGGVGIQGIWLRSVLADSATGVGYHFKNTYSGTIAEVFMVACQSGSCAARGWEVDAGLNLNGLYITDPLCVNTNSTGMRFVAGKQIHITGGEVAHSNGVGISFENNVEEWSVRGVKSGHLGWFAATGATARQTTGLYVGTGNNHYAIESNWWVRNTTTALNNNSAGAANKTIANNLTI